MTKRLKQYTNLRTLSGVVVIVVVAVAGYYLLNTSHAATPYANAYAANGQLSGTASLTTGGSSSNGQAVQFGTAPTTTGSGSDTHGIYMDGDVVSNLTTFAKATGVTPQIMEVYSDGDSLSTIAGTTYSYTGATSTSPRLLIGTSVCGGSVSAPGGTLADGAAGDYNSTWLSVAQNLVSEGYSNAIIRVGFELYGNWFPCSLTNSTDATNYAAYFRQIVNQMRSVSGEKFQFDWEVADPAAGSYPNQYTAAEAYPGSSYVDYVGLDTYDETWDASCGLAFNNTSNATESNCVWNNDIGPELNTIAAFAAANGNKPVVFPEWGLSIRSDGHGLGDDPTFIDNMNTWMKSHNVGFDIYFNSDSGGQTDMLTDGNFPNSLAEYKKDF